MALAGVVVTAAVEVTLEEATGTMAATRAVVDQAADQVVAAVVVPVVVAAGRAKRCPTPLRICWRTAEMRR